jgi:uncharacterized protein DUF6529
MTAPAVTKRPALFLIPLLVGAVVAVALGVFGRVHAATGRQLFTLGFPSLISFKVWFTVAALAFALVQLLTALWIFGKLGLTAPRWAGGLHRVTGAVAFLLTVPVALQCLWVLGFETYSPRVIAHGLLGCIFYGAFVAKVLTLHSKRMPNWAVPWVGGILFTALVGVTTTSAIWYLATTGVPK